MRTHSIKTTYLIHEALVSNTELMKLIKDENIFLVIGEEEAVFPYAVITRTSIKTPSRSNKDLTSEDVVTFNIKVYSDKYDVSVDVADAIRLFLERRVLTDNNIKISQTELTFCSEQWVGDAYQQNMDFQCTVENI